MVVMAMRAGRTVAPSVASTPSISTVLIIAASTSRTFGGDLPSMMALRPW